MENILLVLITTIFISTILNVILKKVEIPTIIGYIFSGIVVNYIFSFMESAKDSLSNIAEFGIVFLMFTIGLEFTIKHLKTMKKEVFVYGTLQMVITSLVFTLLSYQLWHISLKNSIIIGSALSLSSTAIVLKILNEKSEIHSGYGRAVVGILIFQDLAVIPILLMISIFTSNGESISYLLVKTLVSAIFVFFILFIGGKIILNRFFDWVIASNSEEIFLVSVFLVVISASFIAHIFGFSFSLGAFIAGMTIAETRYKYRIEADLIPFRDILLGVFFVTVGMQIDLNMIITHGRMIALLLIVIIFLKALIIYIALYPFLQKRTDIKTALALFQVGEFSLAIFALAFNNGLLTNNQNQILIITVVLSMIITPFVLKNLKNIVDYFTKEPQEDYTLIHSSGYKNHIIICGYGPLGQKMAKHFKYLGLNYIILEHDKSLVDLGESRSEPIILANATQKRTLEAVDLKDAFAVIVAIDNPQKIRLICESIKSIDANTNTVVKVKNESHRRIIEDFDIKNISIINANQELAKILAKEVLNCKIKNI